MSPPNTHSDAVLNLELCYVTVMHTHVFVNHLDNELPKPPGQHKAFGFVHVYLC